MHEFKRPRIKLHKCDTGHSEYMHLPPEFFKIDTSLVIHFHIRVEGRGKSCQTDTCTHINIFTKHLSEATYSFVDKF